MSDDIKNEIVRLAAGMRLPEFSDYERFYDPLQSYPENLAKILRTRETNLEETNYRLRVGRANFDKIKTMDTFEYSPERFPQLCWTEVQSLLDGGFIKRQEDSIFYSEDNGHGKSHLATAIALEMIRLGYRVQFKNFAAMVGELHAAQSAKKLDKYLRAIMKVDLLVIDEFGLNEMDKLSRIDARLVVRIIKSRHERASTFFTTNLKPTEWGAVLNGEEKLTKTVISRISHHSHIFKMDGPFDWRVEHALSQSLAERFTVAAKESAPVDSGKEDQ